MDQFSDYDQSSYAQNYPLALAYSTPYGGDGSGSTEHSHSLLRSLSVDTPLEQQQPYWTDPFNFSHQIADPHAHQHLATNQIDIRDIQNVARPANEEPWSAFHGPYLQNDIGPPPFYPPENAYRSYTITGASINPGIPRSSFGIVRESSTISPDSGFESARHTTLGGTNLLEQTYIQDALDPSQAGWEVPAPRPTSVKSAPQATVKRRPPKLPVPPPCSFVGCKKTFKNQSEAKKHQLKHIKPYMCKLPNCTRQQGFATENDLQRHRKAVHGVEPTVGRKTGYICHACVVEELSGASKWWPRLDNFTAHIKRRHERWNMNNIIDRSEAPRPLDAPSESGYASQAAPSVIPQNEIYQDEPPPPHPMDAIISRRASQVSGMGLFGQFDPLAGVGEGTATDPFAGGYQRAPAHTRESHRGSVHNKMSMLSDAAFRVASPVSSIMDSSINSGFPMTDTNASLIGQHNDGIKQIRWDDSASQRAGSSCVPKHRGSSSSQEDLSMYRTEDGIYGCPASGCDKLWPRECDLRKHLKRHSRPYGCTFPDCYKKFGSRNDWKRHENSQHKLNHMWRCEMEGEETGTLCRKVYSQELDFLTHLQRKHSMDPDSPDFIDHVKSMHLGREGYNRFWCGFCNALINPEEKQAHEGGGGGGIQRSAWATRHRHIGDHLDQDSHIDTWICIQYNKPKGILTKEEKKRQRTRFKSDCCGDDDESDLPDDGIPAPFIAGKRCAADFDSYGGGDGISKMRKLNRPDI